MKVLALNSSPRGEGESKTEMMLTALINGMREAGAEVEAVELRDKRIKNCIGCFTCWTETPGICVHKDDMTQELFPKWLASDLVVYATPLYHFTMNASMKTFVERTLPVAEPFVEHADGISHHPLRHETPAAVVLSVAGFPEDSVFDQLSSYVNFVFGRMHNLVAEIYRSTAETLPRVRAIREDIFDAMFQAGKELVKSMKISSQTMERITQPVTDVESFTKLANVFWKSCIAEGVTPKIFAERELVPRPDSIDTFMLMLALGFKAEAAGDLKATIQFDFSGEQTGPCYFDITDGHIQAKAESAESPDLVVETPFEVWMDIMTGKADGQQMFMEQKYTVTGDIELLMRLGELFGR